MLAHRLLSRVVTTVGMIPLSVALLSPLAPAAAAPIALTAWQEHSVLVALQDPSTAVRYAAVTWLADTQTSNKAIAQAVAGYLRSDLPPALKKDAASALDHMRPAAAAFASRLVPLLTDPGQGVSLAALIRQEKGERQVKRWFFRHERIIDFFLLPAFMGTHSARREAHDMDESFWGVYELLATQLPDAEEQQLRALLVERAADTRRNDLLSRYTLARRLRPLARPSERTPQPNVA